MESEISIATFGQINEIADGTRLFQGLDPVRHHQGSPAPGDRCRQPPELVQQLSIDGRAGRFPFGFDGARTMLFTVFGFDAHRTDRFFRKQGSVCRRRSDLDLGGQLQDIPAKDSRRQQLSRPPSPSVSAAARGYARLYCASSVLPGGAQLRGFAVAKVPHPDWPDQIDGNGMFGHHLQHGGDGGMSPAAAGVVLKMEIKDPVARTPFIDPGRIRSQSHAGHFIASSCSVPESLRGALRPLVTHHSEGGRKRNGSERLQLLPAPARRTPCRRTGTGSGTGSPKAG